MWKEGQEVWNLVVQVHISKRKSWHDGKSDFVGRKWMSGWSGEWSLRNLAGFCEHSREWNVDRGVDVSFTRWEDGIWIESSGSRRKRPNVKTCVLNKAQSAVIPRQNHTCFNETTIILKYLLHHQLFSLVLYSLCLVQFLLYLFPAIFVIFFILFFCTWLLFHSYNSLLLCHLFVLHLFSPFLWFWKYFTWTWCLNVVKE